MAFGTTLHVQDEPDVLCRSHNSDRQYGIDVHDRNECIWLIALRLSDGDCDVCRGGLEMFLLGLLPLWKTRIIVCWVIEFGNNEVSILCIDR